MRTPVRSRYPPPIIQLAHRDDIPELVRVWFAAESSSVLMFLRFPTPEAKSEIIKQVTKQFEDNWGKPNLLIVKALDADTKQITALAVWQKKEGISLNDDSSNDIFAAAGTLFNINTNEDNTTRSQHRTSSTCLIGDNEQVSLPGEALEKYIDTQCKAFLVSWTGNTKNFYLALLMTDPQFQRRGIGTAMLEWGHQRADDAGIPASLIASPFGHHLYQKLGWKDVESPLEVDLAQWVDGAQGGNMGWGVYKWYYMVRLPRTAAK